MCAASNFKTPKIRSEVHRRFVSSLPCMMSMVEGRTQCAHIRHGHTGGLGLKPSDAKCVPLSWSEHAHQHAIGEEKYYGDKLDLAKWTASLLWDNTGNYDECLRIIRRFYDAG